VIWPESNCPDGWTPEQLLVYLDGDLERPASLSLEEHLKDCPVCAAQLESLRQTAALLRDHPDVFHPDADELYGFVSRGDDGEGKIAEHLNACEHCRADVELLQEMSLHPSGSPAGHLILPKALVDELDTYRKPSWTERTVGPLLSVAKTLFKAPFQAPVLALGSVAAVAIFVAITVPVWREFKERGLAEFETAPQETRSLKQSVNRAVDGRAGARDEQQALKKERGMLDAGRDADTAEPGTLLDKPASPMSSPIEKQGNVQSPRQGAAAGRQSKPAPSTSSETEALRIPPHTEAQKIAPQGIIRPAAPMKLQEGVRPGGDTRRSEVASPEASPTAREVGTGVMSTEQESVPRKESAKGKLSLPAARPPEPAGPVPQVPASPGTPERRDSGLPSATPEEKRPSGAPADSAGTVRHGLSGHAAPGLHGYRARIPSSHVGIIPLTVEITDDRGENVPWITFAMPPDLNDRYRVVRRSSVSVSPDSPAAGESLGAASGDRKDAEVSGLHLAVRVHESGDGYDVTCTLFDVTSGRERASLNARSIKAEDVSGRIQAMVHEALQEP
jgi:anti-sigma factor RsiW